MSIQEIPLSHNQKKKLLKAINNDNVIFRDENGDVVVNIDKPLMRIVAVPFSLFCYDLPVDVLPRHASDFLRFPE